MSPPAPGTLVTANPDGLLSPDTIDRPALSDVPRILHGPLVVIPIDVPAAGVHYLKYIVDGFDVDPDTIQEVPRPVSSSYSSPPLTKFDDDEPRDSDGKWSGSGNNQSDTKSTAKPTVYLRFGDWGPNESSTNWLQSNFVAHTFAPEGGLSVYELDKKGNPVDPGGNPDKPVTPSTNAFGLSNNDTGGMMRYRQGSAEEAFKNGVWDARGARAHLVTGDVVGRGQDGEPLLRNIKRVGDWIQDRQKFIPTAEPHPLRLSEDSRDNQERQQYFAEDFPLTKFDDDEPRDDHGQWTSGGNSDPAVSALSHVSPEGFTVHPYTGEVPTTGYQVGGLRDATQVDASVLSDPKALGALLKQQRKDNADLYVPGGHVFIGGWVHQGKLWLEPSENVSDKATATKLGQQRNQVSIWDNAGHAELNTGGTGDLKNLPPVSPGVGQPDGSGAGSSLPGDGGRTHPGTLGGTLGPPLKEKENPADPKPQAERTASDPTPGSDGHLLPSYDDLGMMQKTSGPLGSQGGTWYQDASGQQYLVKPLKDEAHGANEVATGAFYHIAGIPFPNTGVAHTPQGKPVLISEKVSGLTQHPKSGWTSHPGTQAQMARGFGVDALLSHWDAGGLQADNTLVTQHGTPVRIESGGAGLYRAMGQPRGAGFSADGQWSEPQSMRTSDYTWMYGKMSDAQAADSLDRARSVDLQTVMARWNSLGIPKSVSTALASTIEARQAQIPEITAALRYTRPTGDATAAAQGGDYASRNLHGEGQWPLKPGGNPRYGGVVVNGNHQILMVEPRNHFDGVVWTLPKGGPNHNENPLDAAQREIQEETGRAATPVGHIPGAFAGGTGSQNYYYVMKDQGEHPDGFGPHGGDETESTRWATPAEARTLVSQSSNAVVRQRDLNVLDHYESLYPSGVP